MESISPKQIVLQYINERSTLKRQNLDTKKNSSFINYSPPDLKLKTLNAALVKGDENPLLFVKSINAIYFNENNVFNPEKLLLIKYWSLWKSAITINNASRMKIIKRKDITFNEMSEGPEVKKENYYRPNPYHQTKRRSISSQKFTSDANKTEYKGENPLRKSLSIQVHSETMISMQHDQDLLRYYWNNWKTCIRGKKIVSKINSFLSSISEEKNKSMVRIKEKHMVESQKEKLHKVNKISERDSLEDVPSAEKHYKKSSSKKGFSKQMLRSLSEKNVSVFSLKDEVKTSLKRAHSLLENTIQDSLRENHARRISFTHLRRKGSPIPLEMADSEVLERMKIREMERKERWEKLKERRRVLEEERVIQILEEEKEALKQKELLKNLKLKEQKEKQLQEIENQKKLELLKLKRRKQNLKAVAHYERRLLIMGMSAFCNLLTLKTAFLLDADNYYKKKLLSKIFWEWKVRCHFCKERRLSLASCHHRKHLLRLYFRKWVKMQIELTLSKQAAIDFYEMKVQEYVLVRWHRFTCDMIIEENLKLELAEILYKKNLLKKSFLCWKTLPSVAEAERARDKIKSILRQKVLEVVPDFSPDLSHDKLIYSS